jgi:hypothetical protein
MGKFLSSLGGIFLFNPQSVNKWLMAAIKNLLTQKEKINYDAILLTQTY